MNSVFSFSQPNEQPLGDESPNSGSTGLAETASSSEASFVNENTAVETSIAASLDMAQVLQDMIDQLTGFFPSPISGIPEPSIILLNLDPAPVGLGNSIGTQTTDPIGAKEIKGGRLIALIRFTLWDTDQVQVNESMLLLQSNLLAARENLWDIGFLEFSSKTSSSPQFDGNLNAWNRTADYSLLYEYLYEDDTAQSLIARIPIHADQEVSQSPSRESTLVTDEMTRWDDISAPTLLVRGPTTFRNLAALTFFTDVQPTGPVTIMRSYEGATDPIQEFTTLNEFLAALADPDSPQRHARVTFNNFSDFLAEFTPLGTSLRLGDWDLNTTTDEYSGLNCELVPPIQLQMSVDRLEVMYENGSEPLDQVAVMYLILKT